MIKNQSVTIPFLMYNASTFAGVAGLQDVAVRISKDGGATAATTNSAAEVDAAYLPGWYAVTLTATETDAQIIVLQATSATAKSDPVVLDTTPSGLATGAELTALQSHGDAEWVTAIVPTADIAAIKAKTDTLPASPAGVGDAMTLTAAYDAAKTAPDVAGALASYGTAKTSDLEPLATSSELAALETHGDTAWAGATASAVAQAVLTTPADAGKWNTLQNALRGILGTWMLTGDTLLIKTAAGATAAALTVTRDESGDIVGVTI